VKNGGGLAFFLGDRWDRAAYLRLSGAGIFPANISRVGGKDSQPLGEWDSRHPVFSPFDEDALLGTEWAERIEIQPSEGWNPIASIETGTTIIAAKEKIIVCAHSMNRNWSDFPTHPVFVPFVKGFFGFLGDVNEPLQSVHNVYPGVDEKREPGWYSTGEENMDIVVPAPEESFLESELLERVRVTFGLTELSVKAKTRPSFVDTAKGLSGNVELWPWIAMSLVIWLMIEGLIATDRTIPTRVGKTSNVPS